MSPVHPAPENPVLDITECRRKETWFLHKVWYRPKVVMISLREVNLDDLWGMRSVVVKPRCFSTGVCFRKAKRWGEVGDLRRPFINFFIKLQKTVELLMPSS